MLRLDARFREQQHPAFAELLKKGALGLPVHPLVSMVVPARNESARIEAALREVVDCIRGRAWEAEVIVVNDGSTDTTARQILDFSLSAPEVRLLENPGHRGKGFSVRHGALQARGEIVLFTDAGLAVPILEAELLFSAIRSGADIAIGSRWLPRPRTVRFKTRQPVHRHAIGRSFNLLTRVGMGLPFSDTQCGFKAFTREAAQTVFSLQTIEGSCFDPEILFIARQRRMRVVEVPVTWLHDDRSAASYLQDGLTMLREMALIQRNARMGRYDGPPQSGKRTAG